MSATLTWASSGAGTKTGTAIGNAFADLKTLIDSKSGDSTFFWEVGGSNTGSTPYYLLLRRKDGSDGRILIVSWSSAPAGNNAAILAQAPTTNQFYIAWFPNGNTATASNLTASSGTIAGDDSNCVKVAPGNTIGSGYAASAVWFYFDSEEGMAFGTANPAGATAYFFAAGDLLIDAADAVYGCTMGAASGNAANFAGSSASLFGYSVSNIVAGAVTPHIRTNYGATDRQYFQAWMGNIWTAQAIGSGDILSDTSNARVYFVPVLLVANQVKGGGFQLKLRQIAIGPATTGPLTPYNTTGPIVQARQFNLTTIGGVGWPWFTNFKL